MSAAVYQASQCRQVQSHSDQNPIGMHGVQYIVFLVHYHLCGWNSTGIVAVGYVTEFLLVKSTGSCVAALFGTPGPSTILSLL